MRMMRSMGTASPFLARTGRKYDLRPRSESLPMMPTARRRKDQAMSKHHAEQLGPNRGGRPHLDPAWQPSTHAACRVTTATANRLDEVARAAGRRRSQMLRDALDAYLKAS